MVQRISLTRRYILALLLVAGLATSAYLILSLTLQTEKTRSEIINIAGKQRMLSQHIALLTLQAFQQKTEGIPAETKASLVSAINEFETAHTKLTSTPLSASSNRLYFSESGLDEQSKRFVKNSRHFLQLFLLRPEETPPDFTEHLRFAKGPLLQSLDRAVSQFEAEGTQAIEELTTIELAVFLSTLLLLVFEALFIFYPASREIQRLFQAERETSEMAKQSSQQRQVVLDTVGHELQTPLNSLIHELDELKEHCSEAPANANVANAIAASRDIGSTLEAILNYNLGEQSEQELQLTTIHLNDLLENICLAHEGTAKSRGLFYLYALPDLADDQRMVRTDSGKLGTILSNLIENAVQHTSTGGISISFKLSEKNEMWLLQMSVKDTGPGIATHEQSEVFEPFKSAARSGIKERGIGLGLALVKAHTDALGGNIQLHSKPNAGSIFTATVPLTFSADHSPPVKPPYANQSQKKLHCLIAEDNPVNQIIAEKIFAKKGFTIDMVGDGASAVELAQKRNHDLIVLDIVMPGMDGVDACKSIKKKLTSDCPPIFAITANNSANDLSRYLDAGFDVVLGKPIKRDLLDQFLKEYGLQLDDNV